MKDRTWQDVPGAPGARIFPLIRRPDVVCSNSYIIDAPRFTIVIDPGADAEQMEEILQELRGVSRPGHERVSFYLTHCHVDHCFALIKGTRMAVPDDAVVVAHGEGVRALRDFDGDLTQARVMGWDFPPAELQVTLHALLAGDERSDGVLLQSTRMSELRSDEDLLLRYQRIPLGDGLEMVAYHTPGHSPDSVCYQVGRVLFTGDLLFATDTAVVGIIGWDRNAMETSIRNVAWLLDEERIALCLPGHGYSYESAKVKPMLGSMLREIQELRALKTKDSKRIQFTSNYALDLLDEANDNFSIIAGRLYYLAYHLEDLEEGAEARKYLDMLENDRIDEMLTSFNRFVEGFHAGKKIQLQVTMKAVQTMERINAIFKGSDLEAVLDRSLISGTSRLLIDFMNAVKGIELGVDRGEHDLHSLVSAIVEDQRTRPNDDLMECLDDPERYASVLARRIAYIPVFDDVNMTLEGSGTAVWLDSRRFQDSLSGVLLDLAGAEAKSIALRLDGAALEIEADVASSSTIGEKKIRALSRRFALAGSKLTVNDGVPWRCVIDCNETES